MSIKLDKSSIAFFQRQRAGHDARKQLDALESGYAAESAIRAAQSHANALRLFEIRKARGGIPHR